MKNYPHYIIELARKFRKRPTPVEKMLWEKLRSRRLAGLKFKRQHQIGRFVVDFYCSELKLGVEVEGKIHYSADQKEYDVARFEELDALGLQILRLKNEEVFNNMDAVLQKILEFRYPLL